MLGFIYLVAGFPGDARDGLPVPYAWLAVAAGTVLLLGRWGLAALPRNFLQGLLRVPVRIRVQGREVALQGLVDTGNQLVDPLTGTPVVVVEYAALAHLLPRQVQEVFAQGGEVDLEGLVKTAGAGGALPLRLIPFTTIGKRHGLLVGFRPDEIRLALGGREVRTSRVVIGIYNRCLSPCGGYRALLHPDLLQAPGNF